MKNEKSSRQWLRHLLTISRMVNIINLLHADVKVNFNNPSTTPSGPMLNPLGKISAGVGTKPLMIGRTFVKDIRDVPPVENLFDFFCKRQNCFFLDSGVDADTNLNPAIGQFSFLGADPFLIIKSKGRLIDIYRSPTAPSNCHLSKQVKYECNPFDELSRIIESYVTTTYGDMPVSSMDVGSSVPFIGGGVGYFSYDLCHFIEKLPDTTVDDIKFPDMYFAFYTKVVAIDHLANTGYVAISDFTGKSEKVLQKEAEEYARSIVSNARPRPKKVMADRARSHAEAVEIESNFTKEEYLEAIQRAKDYIFAGDIFQVNISQRFHARIDTSPAALYKKLRRINPAPFACYLAFDDKAVVSSSPERFLRVQGRHVQTRPIKGTRPRGRNEDEDKRMRAELMASKKDEAELTMIVDLERNDLGRVCNYGTVKVTEKKVIEKYPTVYHLVATVEGDLHPRYNTIDLLKATFPGGSITGAPKIRAMEIIDELEPTKRNVYTGAIGYFSFNGNIDLNIAIRTFLVKGSDAYFQAGGGIVADSQLESEYDETLHKARALIESVRD